MAGRHPHRGSGPELPGPDGGVALRVSGRHPRPGRDPRDGGGAGGPAAPLGPGWDPDGAEDPAGTPSRGLPPACEGRGRRPPPRPRRPPFHLGTGPPSVSVRRSATDVGPGAPPGPGPDPVRRGDDPLHDVLLVRGGGAGAPQEGSAPGRPADVGAGDRSLGSRVQGGGPGAPRDGRSVHQDAQAGRPTDERLPGLGTSFRRRGQARHGRAHERVSGGRRRRRVLGSGPLPGPLPVGLPRAGRARAPGLACLPPGLARFRVLTRFRSGGVSRLRRVPCRDPLRSPGGRAPGSCCGRRRRGAGRRGPRGRRGPAGAGPTSHCPGNRRGRSSR